MFLDILYSYPSGKPAVVCVDASYTNEDFVKGRDQAFITLVFADEPGQELLAMFTPYGRSAVYDLKGNVSTVELLSTCRNSADNLFTHASS